MSKNSPVCLLPQLLLSPTIDCPSTIDKAEILCVALLTTYKTDMAAAIEHMARTEGLPTSYTERNDVQKKKNSSAVRKSRLKRMLEREGDDNGPPDKQAHFESGT